MEDYMEKLLIIDSESLMKRAFYAIPNWAMKKAYIPMPYMDLLRCFFI